MTEEVERVALKYLEKHCPPLFLQVEFTASDGYYIQTTGCPDCSRIGSNPTPHSRYWPCPNCNGYGITPRERTGVVRVAECLQSYVWEQATTPDGVIVSHFKEGGKYDDTTHVREIVRRGNVMWTRLGDASHEYWAQGHEVYDATLASANRPGGFELPAVRVSGNILQAPTGHRMLSINSVASEEEGSFTAAIESIKKTNPVPEKLHVTVSGKINEIFLDKDPADGSHRIFVSICEQGAEKYWFFRAPDKLKDYILQTPGDVFGEKIKVTGQPFPPVLINVL